MRDPIHITCPGCGTRLRVAAVQGERCPRCGVEFTRFGPNERQAALDFHAIVTGQKHLVEVPGRGWVSVHR